MRRRGLEHYDFYNQVTRLEKAKLLYLGEGKFAEVDLRPASACGRIAKRALFPAPLTSGLLLSRSSSVSIGGRPLSNHDDERWAVHTAPRRTTAPLP